MSAALSARFVLLSAALAATLFAPCAAAQESKPATHTATTWNNVAVAIVAPLDAWEADLAQTGEPLTTALVKSLQKRTGIQQLAGLDRRRPAGIVLQTDGIGLAPVAFVPVADAAAFLESIAPLVGTATAVENLPSGQVAELWKIGRREWTGYVRRRGDWLYVAQTTALLEDAALPKPDAILPAKRAAAKTGEQPDLSLRVYWQNMPEVLRTWAIDRVHQSMRATAEALGGLPAGDAQPEGEQQRVRQLYAGWLTQRLLHDVDEVGFSWTFTSQSAVNLELHTSLLADSPLGTFAAALAQPVRVEAVRQPKLAGPEVATVQVCVPPLQAAWAKLAASAQSEIAAITGRTVESPLLAEHKAWRAAAAVMGQGDVQAALWWNGQRPPAQAVVAASGIEPAAFRRLIGAMMDAEDSPGEALEVPRKGWLGRALAKPDSNGDGPLSVPMQQHDSACYALLSHDSQRIAKLLAEAPAVRSPASKNRPLLDASLRVGPALRLASMVAEDWQAKAQLGKVSLVMPPEKDRLQVTASAGNRSLRLSIEADAGITQAASFGLALWLLAE